MSLIAQLQRRKVLKVVVAHVVVAWLASQTVSVPIADGTLRK